MLVLLGAKTLVIVALELEQLLEMGFAKNFSLERSESAERAHFVALLAPKARLFSGKQAYARVVNAEKLDMHKTLGQTL
jgi:hypothetical protein